MTSTGPDQETRVPAALDVDACWRLLRSQEIGRVAMDTPHGLVVLPVNFALVHGTITFRTAETGLLGSAADYGRRVAFQVDSVDRGARYGWSVLVRGELRTASPAASEIAETSVDTWLHKDDPIFAAIVVDDISGRSLPF